MTIRPKGILYISYTLMKYAFLVSVLSFVVFVIVEEKPFSSGNIIRIIEGLFLITMSIILLVLIILQTREMIRYKIIISNDKIYVAANRDIFLTRHKDIEIAYRGIKAVQFHKYLRPDMIQKGMFFFSAIYILRDDNPKEEYILTMWFSKKQIESIIQSIVLLAEKQNGYSVEVLSEEIR